MKNPLSPFPSKCAPKRYQSEICVYYGPSPKTILSGCSADVSLGGLFLQTEYPLEPEEHIMLTFSLPGLEDKAITCMARVAWVNPKGDPLKPSLPAGVGLQFKSLCLEDLDAISRFIH